MGDELRPFWLLTYAHWDPDQWHGFGGEWRVQACAYATWKEAVHGASVMRKLFPTVSGPHYQRMESIVPMKPAGRRGSPSPGA